VANSNDINTPAQRAYAYRDYTWLHQPPEFGTLSEVLDTNITLGDMNMQNTGDRFLDFVITSNWYNKNKIFYDGTPETASGYRVTIAADSNAVIPLIVTTKTEESSDGLTIIIDPSNGNAVPDSNTTTATIISNAGGPFMLIEVTDSNTNVWQGAPVQEYIVKVTNKGNMDANNAFITWAFPSDWTTTSDGSVTGQDLEINQYTTSSSQSGPKSDATTGARTITISSGCCNDSNKTRTETISVTVNTSQAAQDDPAEEEEETPAAPSSTGSAGSTGGSGGGGATGFSTAEQKQALFQTSQNYDIIRGAMDYFTILVENPFEDANITNVKFVVSGYLSKYIRLEPDAFDFLGVGEKLDVNVLIVAPKYFTSGTYNLSFDIEGEVRRGIERIAFLENRRITLHVHEITKERAQEHLLAIGRIYDELDAEGFYVEKIKDRISLCRNLIELHQWSEVEGILEQTRGTRISAYKARSAFRDITGKIAHFKGLGIETPDTDRLLFLTELAMKRGDYEMALKRIDEAQLTFALETKGEFNALHFLLLNWHLFLTMLIGIAVFAFMSSKFIKKANTNRKIRKFMDEEALLLYLIKEIQKKCFIDSTVSMKDYLETVSEYEKKLAQTVSGMIEQRAILANVFNYSSPRKMLIQERERLNEMVKNAQMDYFEKGTTDSRIYQSNMHSFLKRLSVIEEKIVLQDVTREIRTKASLLRPFWRAWYRG